MKLYFTVDPEKLAILDYPQLYQKVEDPNYLYLDYGEVWDPVRAINIDLCGSGVPASWGLRTMNFILQATQFVHGTPGDNRKARKKWVQAEGWLNYPSTNLSQLPEHVKVSPLAAALFTEKGHPGASGHLFAYPTQDGTWKSLFGTNDEAAIRIADYYAMDCKATAKPAFLFAQSCQFNSQTAASNYPNGATQAIGKNPNWKWPNGANWSCPRFVASKFDGDVTAFLIAPDGDLDHAEGSRYYEMVEAWAAENRRNDTVVYLPTKSEIEAYPEVFAEGSPTCKVAQQAANCANSAAMRVLVQQQVDDYFLKSCSAAAFENPPSGLIHPASMAGKLADVSYKAGTGGGNTTSKAVTNAGETDNLSYVNNLVFYSDGGDSSPYDTTSRVDQCYRKDVISEGLRYNPTRKKGERRGYIGQRSSYYKFHAAQFEAGHGIGCNIRTAFAARFPEFVTGADTFEGQHSGPIMGCRAIGFIYHSQNLLYYVGTRYDSPDQEAQRQRTMLDKEKNDSWASLDWFMARIHAFSAGGIIL